MNKMHSLYKKAFLIRQVENLLLELFGQGKLNGTVHTSVGQEFSALAFAGQITHKDFIFTNHRCHGHYIAYTNDVYGLIAELMGKSTGVSGGVGGSQHLHKGNFFSNGIQGGIMPLAAGFVLAEKLKKTGNIGIVFIGDGTLGEGIMYETMNIISKWQLPLLIVCENNSYAQSTNKDLTIAGDILMRARAFGIKTAHSNTWDVVGLMAQAKESIDFVRKEQKPVFHLVDTYRLNPHSKGDDYRLKQEIEHYKNIDPLNVFARENKDIFNAWKEETDRQLSEIVRQIEKDPAPDITAYYEPYREPQSYSWSSLEKVDKRQVRLINEFFREYLQQTPDALFIGEDVLSPYGGAFKVAQDLSDLFPRRVLTTPISEAAITGIGNGLALAGMKPFVEIMFGDFMTLTMDQIINHASKFYHMYNRRITCPVVIRTPMGGRRGYGPTHSQTLDKFLIGIDNVSVVALNTLIDPKILYRQISREKHPVIVIENKLDYGRKIFSRQIPRYVYEKSSHPYPIVRIRPVRSAPTITIVTYGGMSEYVLASVERLFDETGAKPEIFILTRIHPVDYYPIVRSVRNTNTLFVAEEGSASGGIGSEIIASVTERLGQGITAGRIAALPVPIAASKQLEEKILPNEEKIISVIKNILSQKGMIR